MIRSIHLQFGRLFHPCLKYTTRAFLDLSSTISSSRFFRFAIRILILSAPISTLTEISRVSLLSFFIVVSPTAPPFHSSGFESYKSLQPSSKFFCWLPQRCPFLCLVVLFPPWLWFAVSSITFQTASFDFWRLRLFRVVRPLPPSDSFSANHNRLSTLYVPCRAYHSWHVCLLVSSPAMPLANQIPPPRPSLISIFVVRVLPVVAGFLPLSAHCLPLVLDFPYSGGHFRP